MVLLSQQVLAVQAVEQAKVHLALFQEEQEIHLQHHLLKEILEDHMVEDQELGQDQAVEEQQVLVM